MAHVGLVTTIPNEVTRREVQAAINEFYLRLLLVREDGEGLTEQQGRSLLPDNHPRKQG